MVKRETARKFTLDVGWVFTASIATMGFGLLIRILLGNYFDASGLGAYAMVLTIWGIVTLTTGAGAPGALIKYVAECTEDKDTRDSLVSASIVNGFILGFAAMVIFLVAAPWLESVFNIPDLANLLRIAAISFPFVAANNAFTAYLNAVRRMKSYAAFEIYRKGIVLVFTLLLVWVGMGIPGAVWALVIAPVSVTAAQVVIHKKYFSYTFARYRECTKKLYTFGSKLFADNIVGQLNSNIATLLIGFFLLDSDVGIYAVAVMFFHLFVLVPGAIQRTSYPALSEYHSKQRYVSMKKVIEITTRFSFVFLSIICLVMVFFIDDAIMIFFPGKTAFLAGISTFRIIALLGFVYISLLPASVVFLAIGRPDIPLKITIVNLVINTVVSILLIPLNLSILGIQIGGINGAAISFGLSMVFSAIVIIALIKKKVPAKIRFKHLTYGLPVFYLVTIISFSIVARLSVPENFVGALVIPVFSACLYYFGIVTKGGFKAALGMVRRR